MIIKEPVCNNCANLIRYPFCSAYPDGNGIPEEIRSGENRHDRPLYGDHGIQFQKLVSFVEKEKIRINTLRQEIDNGTFDPTEKVRELSK